MEQIIKARFMHQYKDKAVYESDILIDTPLINQYYDKATLYFEFEIPLFVESKTSFMYKWIVRGRNTQVTRRPLRLVNTDGTVLCELCKRPIKASFVYHPSDFPTIKICCVVDKDEARKLGEIFFK